MAHTRIGRDRGGFAGRMLAVAVLACAVQVVAADARADFDVTNRWVVRLTATNPPAGTYTCAWQLTQAGGDLDASGSCNEIGLIGGLDATIDPVTGAISGTGGLTALSLPFPPTRTFALSATVAPSGTTISGTTTGELTGSFAATLCQNGNLDPGEQCDDGFDFGGCCAATCTFKTDGTACSTNQCQTETSCSAGACVGTPKPAGTMCDRDDNTCTTDSCDASGTCTAGPCSPCCGGPSCDPRPRYSTCSGPPFGKGSVSIKTTPGGARDSLLFATTTQTAILPADLADPAITDYDVCVFWIDEDLGGMFLAGARAPAGQTCTNGKPCARRAPNGTLTYRSQRRDPDGLASLTIKPGAAGKSRVRVVGRGPNLELPERLGPLPGGELLMEVRTPTACWGAFFLLGSFDGVNTPNQLSSKKGFEY